MFLKNVVATLPDIVFWKNKDSVYLGCNDNAARMLMLKSSKYIIAKTDSELSWNKRTQKYIRNHDEKVLNTGLSEIGIKESLVLSNNKTFIVLTDRIPLYDNKNKIIGILIIHTTSHKNHHFSDESFFRHMLDNLPYYIFWKNKNSIYQGCNQNFAKLVGMELAHNLIGKSDYNLSWGEGEAESYIKADRAVMNGEKYINKEETLIRPDGSKIVMLVSKIPVYDKYEKLIGMLGMSTEITKLKQTEEALKIAKEKAEQANQAKSSFLAVISHELRTPLSGILGMAQVLHNNLALSMQREQIDIILRSGKHLLNLIDDILDFSKLEAGKLEMVYEEFNLHKLIKDIVSDAYQSLLDKNVKLIINYDSSTPRKIIADSRRVQQIIMNFISNAIKFTTNGYIKITVKNEKRGKRIKINIKDTGIGIPKIKQNLLFQRFMQLDSKYSRKFTGAGLGLAINKQLVETMGGTIGVSSKYRKGSTFWFTLPLTLEVSPKKLIKRIKPLLDDDLVKPTHILLLEDNLVNQEVTKVMIKNLGCSLDIADNGKQALKMFKKHDYGMIISDISLPGMSGIEVIQKIRAQETGNKHIPIIALTAHALEEDHKNCIEAGADYVLTKPIMQDDLKMTLQKWIK